MVHRFAHNNINADFVAVAPAFAGDKLNSMTDSLGELLMPRLEVSKYETNAAYREFIDRLIEKKYVIGFCVFGGTVETLPVILDGLQTIAKKNALPTLLMACDC